MIKKVVLGVLVALLIALGAGWFWGASGRWDVERAAQAALLRSDLFAGRSAVLDARLDLYNVNFGDASRHLEEAKAPLRQAAERLNSTGRSEEAKRLEAALVQVDEAQALAGRLDQTANTRAADAVKAIDGVIGAVTAP